MALNTIKIEKLAGGGSGVTLWGYATNDTASVVQDPDYFSARQVEFHAGDWLFITAQDAHLVCAIIKQGAAPSKKLVPFLVAQAPVQKPPKTRRRSS